MKGPSVQQSAQKDCLILRELDGEPGGARHGIGCKCRTLEHCVLRAGKLGKGLKELVFWEDSVDAPLILDLERIAGCGGHIHERLSRRGRCEGSGCSLARGKGTRCKIDGEVIGGCVVEDARWDRGDRS